MTFVFWELVGICSYFLIGFYIERHSASTAANKAFIVNRVGDFGMLIGLMAIWSTLGTFQFGDVKDANGAVQPGMFTMLHTEANHYELAPTQSMIDAERDQEWSTTAAPAGEPASAGGQWLLFIAGVGIFCGCMGKSAQFPPCVVARRHGRSDARLRARSFGNDGRRRRLPRWPRISVVLARNAARDRHHRMYHTVPRGDDRDHRRPRILDR
jgi:hypothetical protein